MLHLTPVTTFAIDLPLEIPCAARSWRKKILESQSPHRYAAHAPRCTYWWKQIHVHFILGETGKWPFRQVIDLAITWCEIKSNIFKPCFKLIKPIRYNIFLTMECSLMPSKTTIILLNKGYCYFSKELSLIFPKFGIGMSLNCLSFYPTFCWPNTESPP